MVTPIKHPNNTTKIYSFLDPAHMIKLCRNSFAEIYLNSELGPINFNFVKELNRLQENEDLRLANSLGKQHIEFSKKKMNVRLATQTISASVADAIDFLRVSGNSIFLNSEATTEFLRSFDRLFDMMNSRSPFAKNFKSPLTLNNKHVWEDIFAKSEAYIKSLKVYNKSILQHERRTFALGFLVNISSYRQLANDLLNSQENKLKYLLTYKTSQDHL